MLRFRVTHTLLVALTGIMLLIAPERGAKADDRAHAAVSDGTFGVVDLTTGAFSLLGNTGGLVGLGEVGGKLYGIGLRNRGHCNTLYTVNPADGSLTLVGNGSACFGNFGSTTAGLFGLDYSMNLYSVDPTTGASALIGPTGLSLPFHGGLSNGSSTLYLTAELNQFTGPATL